MITARSKERYRFAPWGVGGGQAGTVGRSSIRHADGSVLRNGEAVPTTAPRWEIRW
jgi:N-methylhydantoinase B/oxoprolinase/acetone carboxylase alpha subunit